MSEGQFALFYEEDDVLYSTALSEEQFDTLQLLLRGIGEIKVIKNRPQGKVVDLMKEGEK